MNPRRTGAVALKALRSLKHDPRSIALILVAPLLAMAIFGYAFGTEVGNVPTAIVNEDEGGFAAEVIASLDADAVDVTILDDWDVAREGVRDGEYRVAVHFPPGFTRDASPGSRTVASPVPGMPSQERPTPPNGTTIGTFVDGSAPSMVGAAMHALSEALAATMQDEGAESPVTVDVRYAYAEGARFMDAFVPGIIAFAALLFTMLLTLMSFVGERTSGTLARLLVTPARESEIVLGYALAFGLVGVVQGAVLLGVALLVFDVLIVGSLALAFLIVALMAVDALSLGILLSAGARKESQAVQFIPLVIFPAFLLSGIFVPVESLPPWLQPLAWTIPPTYATEGLRNVMLRGWGLAQVWPQVVALAAFAVAFLALAVAGLKRGRRFRA